MSREPLDALLVVQGHDTNLDQLRHRLATLDERTTRDEATARLDAVRAEAATVGAERDELARRLKRIEDEVASIDDKRKQHDARLYGGTVTNARELQDLQEEVDSLGRRITQLEDEELELMEQLEPLDERLAALAADEATAGAALDAAELALTAAEAEIGAALDAEAARRDEAGAGVDAALLAHYETLRAGGGGVGIARLAGGNRCGGCHLTLSAVQVAALKKQTDAVAHCEECGRILVP